MAGKAPKIPHVSWRDGRPRFQPAKGLREAGWKGRDLRHPDGRWYTAGEALDWSRKLLQDFERDKRSDAAAPIARRQAAPLIYSVAKLMHEWQQQSPKWGKEATTSGKREVKIYAENTRRNYRQAMKTLEEHDHDLYHAAVDALDTTILFGLYEDLWGRRGLSSARAVILTLSSAIAWGIRRGKVKLDTNPALKLGMQVPKPRVRFGEREEIRALVAAADAMGRPEIGDAVMLGLWTGQRQQDRLALVVHRSALTRGRRVFRQKKTGEIVAILEAPELAARLAAASARRREAGVVDPHVVLDEKCWAPFARSHYSHLFAEVRELAVRGCEAEDGKPALKPCPSLADFHDQDLRDTAVTWMALGGATIPEIISVTGHTPESATQILRHYLARHPEMGDAGIGKMIVRWNEIDGEEEEGL